MNREFFHFLKFVMKGVRNINIYTLNVMIQVPVTF
jgi:hypothetical protein